MLKAPGEPQYNSHAPDSAWGGAEGAQNQPLLSEKLSRPKRQTPQIRKLISEGHVYLTPN